MTEATDQKPHFTYPTDPGLEMYDPELFPPPKGAVLLVASEGGVTRPGLWYDGAIAWQYLPKIPKSVKQRQDAKAELRAREGYRGRESEKTPGGYSYVPGAGRDAYAPVRIRGGVQER